MDDGSLMGGASAPYVQASEMVAMPGGMPAKANVYGEAEGVGTALLDLV